MPSLQRWTAYGKALESLQIELRGYHKNKGTFRVQAETDCRISHSGDRAS